MTKRPEPYMRHWNRETFDAIDRLGEKATDAGVSMAGLAMGWLHRHPDVTSSIVGPRRPSHFDPVEEAMNLEMSQSEWDEITVLFRRDT
jgi:aryl-alcohol dehydrogenase-like predicted oxidoreductase